MRKLEKDEVQVAGGQPGVPGKRLRCTVSAALSTGKQDHCVQEDFS